MASRQRVPREPVAAGSREFRFYISEAPEINKRFAGKHVAIIGDRVVASGRSPLEVYKRAKKSHPNRRPLLAEFSPVLGEILRPVANVELRAVRGHWFPASMYVDSGADMTLIPSDFGKLLGMDLNKNRSALAGVTGSPMKVSLQSTEIRIGASTQEAKLAVALRNDVPYLLGRVGIFNAFKITFEEYKQLTSFHRSPTSRHLKQ